jgi:hypothetical protein
MSLNPLDLVKFPFRIADKISKPVMDKVEKHLGKDIDEFVSYIPGGKMLQETAGNFNRWLLPEPIKDKEDKEEDIEFRAK